MYNVKKGTEKLFWVSILLISLLITPNSLFGEEADKKPEVESKSKADFVLTIKEDLISLSAKDASLKDIVEEMGRRMKIEVVARIPKEEKITIEFDKLSIENAIKKFSTSYAYVWNSEKEGGKLTKIVLLPEGKGTAVSTIKGKKRLVKSESKEESPRPEPFKFEFDPSEFVDVKK